MYFLRIPRATSSKFLSDRISLSKTRHGEGRTIQTASSGFRVEISFDSAASKRVTCLKPPSVHALYTRTLVRLHTLTDAVGDVNRIDDRSRSRRRRARFKRNARGAANDFSLRTPGRIV